MLKTHILTLKNYKRNIKNYVGEHYFNYRTLEEKSNAICTNLFILQSISSTGITKFLTYASM